MIEIPSPTTTSLVELAQLGRHDEAIRRYRRISNCLWLKRLRLTRGKQWVRRGANKQR